MIKVRLKGPITVAPDDPKVSLYDTINVVYRPRMSYPRFPRWYQSNQIYKCSCNEGCVYFQIIGVGKKSIFGFIFCFWRMTLRLRPTLFHFKPHINPTLLIYPNFSRSYPNIAHSAQIMNRFHVVSSGSQNKIIP